VAQIVDADAVEFCGLAHRLPRPMQISARSSLGDARDDVRVVFDPGDFRQHRLSGGAEVERLFAGLAVRSEQDAALHIDLRPLGVQNFSEPSARQDKQPHRRDCVWVELDATVYGLGGVLGVWFSFVNGKG